MTSPARHLPKVPAAFLRRRPALVVGRLPTVPAAFLRGGPALVVAGCASAPPPAAALSATTSAVQLGRARRRLLRSTAACCRLASPRLAFMCRICSAGPRDIVYFPRQPGLASHCVTKYLRRGSGPQQPNNRPHALPNVFTLPVSPKSLGTSLSSDADAGCMFALSQIKQCEQVWMNRDMFEMAFQVVAWLGIWSVSTPMVLFDKRLSPKER